MPGTISTALPSFSRDQHHETDAANGKGEILTGDKPENCGVLSHHSNNKTNVLPTFQVHNLLTGTFLLSAFFIHKNVAKIKKRFFV